jgi:hypothetical protein
MLVRSRALENTMQESTYKTAKDYGYKLGDLFVRTVSPSDSWQEGAVIQFIQDDGTSCPMFQALHESATVYRFGPNGEAAAYCELQFVRPAGYYEVLGYLLDKYPKETALRMLDELYGDEDNIESILEDADF